ncbi:hypothetical protein [Frankia sp. ACN1ag]|uniref:hypothetical protein n=1 Tax=Frankia sp. ACN1ag TaxID=102891 RepID=UPI0006DC603D|nr:hypothetical protein [Frankia sp. ACN1ag]KQC35037.1 hypothetical protein UK82_28660 [Frankia sp. ACN1ag]
MPKSPDISHGPRRSVLLRLSPDLLARIDAAAAAAGATRTDYLVAALDVMVPELGEPPLPVAVPMAS